MKESDWAAIPDAMNPLFSTPSINQDIYIRNQVDVRLKANDTWLDGKADIILKWLPRPRIIISALFTKSNNDLPIGLAAASVTMVSSQKVDQRKQLRIEGWDSEIEVLIMNENDSSEVEGISMILMPRRGPTNTGLDSRVNQVLFALPNFLQVAGLPIKYISETQKRIARSRIELNYNGWQLSLESVANLPHLIKDLKLHGGYAITHWGRIRREDNRDFSSEEIEPIIFLLTQFFSFARGISIAPVLACAYTQEGDLVHEDWGIRMIDAWQPGIQTWFDNLNLDQLIELFPKFATLFSDPTWESALSSSLYWYKRSNRNTDAAGTDGSIILSQTALELLSWTFLVQNKKLISKSRFKKNSTADNLRLFFSHLNIPIEIPEALSNLKKAFEPDAPSKDHEHIDGIGALTSIRNNIIHPDRQSVTTNAEYFETWVLSQWYIEMAILSMCQYTGTYWNRIKWNGWQGDVEPVPWA